MKYRKYPILIIFCIFISAIPSVLISANNRPKIGPFPVKGPIFNETDQPIGTAHVYPRYVEIFDTREKMVGKVGVLVESGIAKLFIVGHDENRSLVGYATSDKIFNREDKIVGTYFWTPTWSFVHKTDGKRAGKVKCIAWPRVCAAAVGGYLLNLLEGKP
jgi:hypothetical protein